MDDDAPPAHSLWWSPPAVSASLDNTLESGEGLTQDVTNGNIHSMTGEELKTLRTRLRLTQAELGKRLGVARVTVARWELGLRRVPELAARLVQHVAKEVRAEQKKQKRS